jgi:flagellar basal body-associated protein FliL
MSDSFGTPITPAPEPKKSNTTMIIIVVVVVLLLCCCCALAVVLWQYGDQIMFQLESLTQALFHLLI